MKHLMALAATLALSAPGFAHDTTYYGGSDAYAGTTTYGYTTVYQIISITQLPHLAGYQELNLNPAPAQTVAPGVHGGEAILVYPYEK